MKPSIPLQKNKRGDSPGEGYFFFCIRITTAISTRPTASTATTIMSMVYWLLSVASVVDTCVRESETSLISDESPERLVRIYVRT